MAVPAPRIPRLVTAALLVILAACQSGGSTSPAASVPPGATATPEPRDTPSPAPTEAADHVATGLAMVRFLPGGSPVSQVFVVDAAGELQQVTGLGPEVSAGATMPAWSPDRSQLLVGSPKVGGGVAFELSVVNADGSGERVVASTEGTFIPPVDWSPDGNRFLFVDLIESVGGPNEPSIWLVVPATGEATRLATGTGARWLPDGHRITFLATVADPANPGAKLVEVQVMDVDGGQPAPFELGADPIWSPDGTAVLFQADDGALTLADADGSNPRTVGPGDTPVWSPDGSRFVYAYDTNADGLPLLAAMDREGRRLWSDVIGSSPTWSPDGQRLAVEILYPELLVEVLDAETADLLWEIDGTMPSWTE